MGRYFNQAFWSLYASSYDNLSKHFRPYQDLVSEVCDHVDQMAKGRSLRILDAGCGTGNYTFELAARGHKVVGIDSSPAMLARAEKKRLNANENLRFLHQDLTQELAFGNEEFDASISTMVLYALPQPQFLVQELKRVVKPGGGLVAVTLCRPVQVFGSVVEAFQHHGLSRAARTVVSLAGVGMCNLVVNVRQRSGAYSLMGERTLATLLEDHGWDVKTTSTTYTCDIASLAVATRS